MAGTSTKGSDLMALIALIVWIFLMMFWLFGGTYLTYDPARPALLSNTLVAWACVFILGLFVFGAFGPLVIPH
jgi:hypothetical protein